MKTLADLSYEQLLARAAAVFDLAELRVDVSPFTEGGKRWWTKGEGLKKWATKAHPWTALYHHILKWHNMTPAYAARIASSWFHLVFGFWPGEKHVGGVKVPGGHRSADDGAGYGAVAVTGNVWLREHASEFLLEPLPELADGEPMGELDDDTLALLAALAELDEEFEAGYIRAFDPAKHKRWPKGHPLAGKFRPMVDLLKQAIAAHKPGDKDHPFKNFTRPQLVNAAKARGIPLQRGEPRDSIAAKLLADLTKPGPATANPPSAGTPAAPVGHKVYTLPIPGLNANDKAERVIANGADIGTTHTTPSGEFVAFGPSGGMGPPGGPWKTRQEATDALLRKAFPVPGQPLPAGAVKVSGPGLAGLKIAQLKVPPKIGGWNGKTAAKSSLEIFSDGVHVGSVHDFGYGWTADDPDGHYVSIPGLSVSTKSDAIAALVANSPHLQPPPAAALPNPTAPGVIAPEITAAQEVLYGIDPKANTAARQLSVYGALKPGQFHQLGSAEKSTLLGDLSYIATTSKGPGGDRAKRLLDRFTPPGTTPGAVANQPINVPAGARSDQTHVADPKGALGLLSVKPSQQRGRSGDGWTRNANGGTGPWGQYGAAGLMLRHVDAKGEERFLMIERGPGISDPGKWQFPGGAKDEKETFYEGATREVVEELGFKSTDLDTARVHGTHTHEVLGVQVQGLKGGTVPWAYVSVAATVDKQLLPDLSTPHAQLETSDAKWMTRAEIDQLDKKGKLLAPLAGGKLQNNVISLFPPTAATVTRPGPVTKKLPRLTGTPSVPAAPAKPHKPSLGQDLLPDTTTRDALRQTIKRDRVKYAGKVADDRLAAIGALQGYDAAPTVASKSEMDRLLATGNYIEAWRGQKGATSGSSWNATRGGKVSSSKTAAQITEEFRSGPAYYGIGMFGNGYYFSTDKKVAVGYSDATKNSLIRVLIPKDAKIVPHAKALREAQANSLPYSKAKGRRHESGTLYNEGRYAAAKGNDMIEISHMTPGASHVASAGRPSYNILNRSILIVEEAQ